MFMDDVLVNLFVYVSEKASYALDNLFFLDVGWQLLF